MARRPAGGERMGGNSRRGTVRQLSKAEMERLVDREARRLLGMSAEKFYRAARSGTLPESAAATYLLMLSGARSG